MTTAQYTHDSSVLTGGGLLFEAETVALGVFSAQRPLAGVVVRVVTAVVLWRSTDPEASVVADSGETPPADGTLESPGVASAGVLPAPATADGSGWFRRTGPTAETGLTAAEVYIVLGALSLQELSRRWTQ
jgi:hypothetical protein